MANSHAGRSQGQAVTITSQARLPVLARRWSRSSAAHYRQCHWRWRSGAAGRSGPESRTLFAALLEPGRAPPHGCWLPWRKTARQIVSAAYRSASATDFQQGWFTSPAIPKDGAGLTCCFRQSAGAVEPAGRPSTIVSYTQENTHENRLDCLLRISYTRFDNTRVYRKSICRKEKKNHDERNNKTIEPGAFCMFDCPRYVRRSHSSVPYSISSRLRGGWCALPNRIVGVQRFRVCQQLFPGSSRTFRQQYSGHPLGQSGRSRSEEHTSELQSPCNLVCRLLLEKKKIIKNNNRVLILTLKNRAHPCQL